MLPWYPSLHPRKATKLSLLASFHTWLSSLAPHIWKENRHLITCAEKTWKCHRWHLLSRPTLVSQLSCLSVKLSTFLLDPPYKALVLCTEAVSTSLFFLLPLCLFSSLLPTLQWLRHIQYKLWHITPVLKKLYWVTLIHRIWPKPPTRL